MASYPRYTVPGHGVWRHVTSPWLPVLNAHNMSRNTRKLVFMGFRPGPTQTGLCMHRWLGVCNFGFKKKRHCTTRVAKIDPAIFAYALFKHMQKLQGLFCCDWTPYHLSAWSSMKLKNGIYKCK